MNFTSACSGRKMLLVILMAASGLSGCFKNLTEVNVVFESNFEGLDSPTLELSGWNNSVTFFGPLTEKRTTNFRGSTVLGKLNSNAAKLELNTLPAHQILRIEFDLYLHDKWQNDLWRLSVDNADQLVTGFSNYDQIKQSYPGWLFTGAPNPAGKNAMDIFQGSCGLSSSPRGTSMYRIVHTMSHTSPDVLIVMNDAGNFLNDTCQRAWSIDNFKVTVLRNP